MTFTLKEFAHLKKHFDETIKILIEKHIKVNNVKEEDKKDVKITDFKETKRIEQIQFIQAVIAKLEVYSSFTQGRNLFTARPANRYSAIAASAASAPAHVEPENSSLIPKNLYLYAAMLLIRQKLMDECYVGEPRSMLYQRLNLAMGFNNPDEKPSEQQLATIYKSFNLLTREIFLHKNSREGFEQEHFLSHLPQNFVMGLIKLSYEKEKTFQEAFVKSLKENTAPMHERIAASSKDDRYPPTHYRPKISYAPIVNPETNWEEIKQQFDDMRTAELGAKNKADLDALQGSSHKKRATHLLFLEAIRNYLDAIGHATTPKEKIAIFQGAMHLVREHIRREEYRRAPLTRDSINESQIHKALSKILDAKEETLENIADLVSAAKDFMCAMVIIEKNTQGLPCLRHRHIFSDIKDFSIQTMINFANETIMHCRVQSLDRMIKDTKKTAKHQTMHEDVDKSQKSKSIAASVAGFASSMWGGKKEKPHQQAQPSLSDSSSTEEEDTSSSSDESDIWKDPKYTSAQARASRITP